MRVTVFAILFYVLTVSSASAGIAGNVWLDSCEKGESKKHKAWEYYLGLCRGNIEGAGVCMSVRSGWVGAGVCAHLALMLLFFKSWVLG